MKGPLAAVILPELLIVGAAIASLSFRRSRLSRGPALFAAAAVLAAFTIELIVGAQVGTLVPGVYRQDRFALFAKAVLLASTFVWLLAEGDDIAPPPAPAVGPLLACLFGMLVASAPGPVTLLLWTELAVVAVLAFDGRPAGAGRRRLRLFAIATGLAAVAGVALLYAVTRSASFPGFTSGRTAVALTAPAAIAVLLVIVALAAEMMAARWLGAIVAGTAGIALLKFTAATAGAAGAWSIVLPVGAAVILLAAALGSLAGWRPGHLPSWAALLQLGWLIAGAAAGGRAGIAASLFLLGAFLLAAAACRGLRGERDHGVAGLMERGQGRGLGYAACLVSLAGLPPLAGFFGVFAVASRLAASGLFWVVAVGLLATSVLAFAVLRDLRLVFLASTGERAGERSVDGGRVTRGTLVRGGGLLAAGLLLVYGLLANPISSLALQGAAAAGPR
ncbi:MAG: hypothetical protein M3Z13_07220 [Candidatus Dormibacteraeota bacterium]|nr:hypothetical protein [Candidatus Dormibacteraeota bacterium]